MDSGREASLKPPDHPAVSVIIPARDAAATVERTLDALSRQEFDDPFEVILVDDGSRDRTAEIAQRFGRFVKLIRGAESQGPGAARNRGVRVAAAPVLAFTDADCFPTPGWLAAGVRALADADLVQGRVAPDPRVARTPFDRTLWVEDHGGFYQTANLFVRREIFAAVGGFRDWALEQPGRRRWSVDRRRGRATRTPIGEDTLFAWTARRRGARSAFCPEALVYHAVFSGDARDEMADRWHWARDMPGLARFVPELRERTFYRHWFFNIDTAQFDLAVAGLLAAAISRRKSPLVAAYPYARRLVGQARQYDADGALRSVVGTLAVEGVTLLALLVGSVEWRSLVI